MKNTINFILILSFLNLYSQNKEQELLVKNKISKRIIQGFEYRNDTLFKQTFLVEEIDKFGNTISFKNYDINGSLVKETNYKFSEDGMIEYGEMLDQNGILKYSMVTIKNKEKRSVRRMQINAKNDTLNDQIWIRDKNLNDSILFRVIKGKRILSRKWNYNNGNILISESRYDKNGDLFFRDSFTYEKSENCWKKRNSGNIFVSIKCIEGNKEISKILKNDTGYLSGIKLILEEGGKRIETKLENGLLEKIEYFSKKGKILAEIKYKYENN